MIFKFQVCFKGVNEIMYLFVGVGRQRMYDFLSRKEEMECVIVVIVKWGF